MARRRWLFELLEDRCLLAGLADPQITELLATPDPVLQGADLTLTAIGVDDPDGDLAQVRFYHDTNGNGALDAETDLLWGVDTNGDDGWSITAPATGVPAGIQTFLTQVEDAAQNTSHVVSTSVQIDAAVYWDGDAGDLLWNTAANWSGDTLPGASDAVVINTPGEITVTHASGSTTIARLQSGESLDLAGGSLTVGGASSISGSTTVRNATLRVQGSGASWVSLGPVTLTGANLAARQGAFLSLPTATSYTGGAGDSFIDAIGVGSRIEFPVLTTLTGSTGNAKAVYATADDGGEIDLSSLDYATLRIKFALNDAASRLDLSSVTSFSNQVDLWAQENAVFELPQLATISAGGRIQSRSGAVIRLPALAQYSASAGTDVNAIGPDARIEFPVLTTFTNANVSVSGTDSRVELPVLATAYGGQLQVTDAGVIHAPVLSTLDATNLRADENGVLDLRTVTTYTAPSGYHSINAVNGGRIDLSGATTFDGGHGRSCNQCSPYEVTVTAGTGGVVDLSELSVMTGRVVVSASGAGSLVDFASLETIVGGWLQVRDVAVIHAPVLSTLTATELRALDGGLLDLSSVTHYEATGSYYSIAASGAGSRIALTGLETLRGGVGRSCNQCSWYKVTISANDGAVVDFGDGLVQLHNRIVISGDGLISGGILKVTAGANLSGTGVIAADLVNDGQLRPGPTSGIHEVSGAGRLAIQGNFTQSEGGVLEIQLGGVNPASQFDQLAVSGTANLAGVLSTLLISGFTPAAGDAFPMVTFDSRHCDFHTKNGLDLGGGLYLAASFTDTEMILNAGSTPDSGQQCLTTPQFTNITVEPDPAKAGDPLSITFEVDVPLQAEPIVTVDGNPAAFVSQSGTAFSYSYLVTGTEREGLVDVVLTAVAAVDGGVGSETIQAAFDFTNPVISGIAASPNPVDVGQMLSVAVTANEPLGSSTVVSIGGLSADLTQVSGATYTYTRQITGGEGIGTIPIEIEAVDLAGNTGDANGAVVIFSGGFGVEAAGIELSNDTPQVGETISGAVTIHNSGIFAAVNVPVQVTLIEPAGSRDLGRFVLPSLPALGVAALPIDFAIQTSGVHVLRVDVDPDEAVLEDDESNNTATRSLLVGAIAREPIAIGATLSTASGSPGTAVRVTGTASYDAAFSPAGPVAGGPVTVRIPGADFIGTTITDNEGRFTLDFTMPAVPGEYLAETRASDITTEGVAILPFRVSLPPAGVDLVTSGNQIHFSDDSPIPGQAVTIRTRVFNGGGEAFNGTATIQFFAGETLIGTAAVGSLAPGAVSDLSITHAFDTAGTHEISVIVDPEEAVGELNEANNSGARSIHVVEPVPDLAPVAIAVSDSTPSTVQTVTLTATVSNMGGAAAEDIEVQFFDNGNPLGMGVIPVVAGQGGTASLAIQAMLSPAGNHVISVVVDPDNALVELNEANNTRTQTVAVHAPAADLAPGAIDLSNAAPAVNEVTELSVTVRNQGEVASGPFEVLFFQDGSPLGMQAVSDLDAGQTATLALSASFASAGLHTLTVVVDHAEVVVELSESNNRSTRAADVLAAPLADLAVDAAAFRWSDANPGAGDLVTLTLPVDNLGAASAVGVTVQLQVDGTTVATATTTPADISAGANAEAVFVFTAPLGDGFHLLEVVADPGNAITESDENNNRDVAFLLVGDHPDLLPYNITFSDGAPFEGDVLTISATIQNDGELAAREILVRFLDGSEAIGQAIVASLGAGEFQQISVPFATAGRGGNRLIQVLVDPDDRILETNEGNNLVSVILPVTSGDAIPPVTTATRAPDANAAGWNRGDVTLTLSAADQPGGSGVAWIRYAIGGGPATTVFADVATIPFTAEGIYSVTYQAVDFKQNVEPLRSIQVRIDRTPPAAVHTGPFTAIEGDTLALDGTASTDALSGIAAAAWALDGDGQFDDGNPAVFTAGDGPATRDIAFRVLDLAGNETIVTTQVNILNAPPTIDSIALSEAAIEEGDWITVSGTCDDPGWADETYSGTAIWSDGTLTPLMIDAVNRTFRTTRLFTDDHPDSGTSSDPFFVEIRIDDGDGGSVTATSPTLIVNNVAPAFDAGQNETLLPSQAGFFHRNGIGFSDPGTDEWSGTVNFGDGSGDQPLVIDSSSKSFDLGHTYTMQGTFAVTITIRDDDLGMATDNFAVEVIFNTPPVAQDDSIATGEDTAFTFDVLADNGHGPDTDAQDNIDPARTIALSLPSRGVLVNHQDGTFTYDPSGEFESLGAGQSDSETFRHQIEDAFGATDTATVTITIRGQNDAPMLLSLISDILVNEGAPDSIIDIGEVFGDVDANDVLALSVAANTNPAIVGVSLAGDRLTLDFLPDRHGTAMVTILATDPGGLTAQATFTVTVLSAAQQIQNIIGMVELLRAANVLNAGNTNALLAKLNGALDKLARGNTQAAINQLNAFINQVEAFVNSGKLTPEQGQPCIDATRDAIASASPGGGSTLIVAGDLPLDQETAHPLSRAAELLIGTVGVSLHSDATTITAEQQARLQDTVAVLHETFAQYGMTLVVLDGVVDADTEIRVEIAAHSACGDASQGILGCAAEAGEITLLDGWDWHTGADATAAGAGQFDFQTILTHELGHALGLTHSADSRSTMYPALAPAEARREITLEDLMLVWAEHSGPEALVARGHAARPRSSQPTGGRMPLVERQRTGFGDDPRQGDDPRSLAEFRRGVFAVGHGPGLPDAPQGRRNDFIPVRAQIRSPRPVLADGVFARDQIALESRFMEHEPTVNSFDELSEAARQRLIDAALSMLEGPSLLYFDELGASCR